ncbi:MAG: hypothetical protein H6587_02810 [Flavobacteriales bacterium]|nr:hypothetical protein [Flavobacteriales bacterium]MCB9363478.1 hypothetical protein [Flavobacteriales bacterium]
MTSKKSDILVSKAFLIGLAILLLNDWFLKYNFSNFITGKLSDIAGLFIFPLFLYSFLPKQKNAIYILTCVCFIIWKLPITNSIIEYWNSFNLYSINRVIDYTDLFCLLILPFSYNYKSKLYKLPLKHTFINSIGVVAFFAFCSTAGTHGSLAGYSYPISKKSLEKTINAVIEENDFIERPTSSDYYNSDGYITILIGHSAKHKYVFRFYGGEEHWKNNPNQSEIFICYAYDEYGYAQSEGNDIEELTKYKVVKFFELSFVSKLDEKLKLKHLKTK